ncbi:hypothetical protein NBZ79_15500 [Sneathiella marina]|uniref:Uncharacterized protein n=1 Tax=Sneathiella marina TaxID=2950108 RepID=A0ABY4W137_9PROT|nr:hypothetical protein [Sneathiella marina]USG60571.1 hypothetical protein NBZ79_15500 [Sneathiella marina]
MVFSKEEIAHLPLVISNPRFKTYLGAMDNNPEAALQLYQWNVQVSAEFIFPLHVCEVAVRNAVSSIQYLSKSTWRSVALGYWIHSIVAKQQDPL